MPLTLETEVGEESDILGALLTLGEGSENKESSPTLALAQSNTLQANRQAVEIAFGNVSPLHHPPRTHMLEAQIHERGDDASGKDPFRDRDVDRGLNSRRPGVT